MKKNILVQIGERAEARQRIIPATYGEDDEILTPESVETYTVNVPVMEPQNVEMTAEEIAELEAMQAVMPEPTLTPEQRLDALESTSDDIILMMADLIGGE